MKQTPRPDQVDVYQRLRREIAVGHRRVLVRAPTGWGKTTLVSMIAEGASDRKRRTWVLTHRRELVQQVRGRLEQNGVRCGVIQAGLPMEDAPAHAVSIDTVRSRLHLLEKPDLVVVDECHHIAAATWSKVVEWCDATMVGVTATPFLGDGRPLPFFTSAVDAPPARALVGPGLPLVDPEIYAGPSPILSGVKIKANDFVIGDLAVEASKVVGDVVSTWMRRSRGLRTIAFAVNIEHSLQMVAEFRAAGIAAEHVDGSTPADVRAGIFLRLAAGETLVVSNVGIVTEGFDCPNVESVILARPTRSLILYLQMIGRGLRAATGKKRAIILDHGMNAPRHGHPFLERPLSLAQRVQVQKAPEESIATGDAALMRVCAECLRCNDDDATSCAFCGAALKAKRKMKEDRRVELVRWIEQQPLTEQPRFRLQEWRRIEASVGRVRGAWAATAVYEKTFGRPPHRDGILSGDDLARYWAMRRRH